MVIILKHINIKTTRKHIKDFLSPELKGGLLRKSGHIRGMSFLIQKNIHSREIQTHGLVEVLPDLVAERIVKKLNGKVISNKRVAINKYISRDWHNDRRGAPQYRFQVHIFNDRVCDRRGQYENITPEERTLNFSGKRAHHMNI